MKPKTSILNPAFKYVPSGQTDLRKTFNRVRRDLAAAQPAASNVVQVQTGRAGKSR